MVALKNDQGEYIPVRDYVQDAFDGVDASPQAFMEQVLGIYAAINEMRAEAGAQSGVFDQRLSALTGGVPPETLDTITELAQQIQALGQTDQSLAGLVASKAPLASPQLTGSPSAPTPPAASNDGRIATTAFVKARIADIMGGVPPETLDTVRELADAVQSMGTVGLNASQIADDSGVTAPAAKVSDALASLKDGKLDKTAQAADSARLGGVAASVYARTDQDAVFEGSVSWGASGQRTEIKHDAGAQGSKSGFFRAGAPTNYPDGASGAWHLIDCSYENTAINYALQIAGSLYDQELYVRKKAGYPDTPWHRLWHSGNYNLAKRVVQNHVTAAKVYAAATDTHLDLLDTAITCDAGDKVRITATVSLETNASKVFYLKRNGVEIGSAGAGAYAGLVAVPYDAENGTTMSSVHFAFIDETPDAGLNTYSLHLRGYSYGVWLNRTVTGESGLDYNSERAASIIILER